MSSFFREKLVHNGKRLLVRSAVMFGSASAAQAWYIRQKYLNRPNHDEIPEEFPTSGVAVFRDVSEQIKDRIHRIKVKKVTTIENFRKEFISERMLEHKCIFDEDFINTKKEALIQAIEAQKEAVVIKKEALKQAIEAKKDAVVAAIEMKKGAVISVFEATGGKITDVKSTTEKMGNKVKLIILGDSLVCGVGSDTSDSAKGPGKDNIFE